MTNQASAIKSCLGKYGHLTADEVYFKCKPYVKRLAKATVYRNLNHMTEHGEIFRFSVPGMPDVYDKTPTAHAHFICKKCGRVCDIEGVQYQHILGKAAKGYTATDCDVTVRGLCPDCAE